MSQEADFLKATKADLVKLLLDYSDYEQAPSQFQDVVLQEAQHQVEKFWKAGYTYPAPAPDALREALEGLRQVHLYVEDSWYSCPKAEEGCADDNAGTDCNCGADSHNAKLDAIIKALSPVGRGGEGKDQSNEQ